MAIPRKGTGNPFERMEPKRADRGMTEGGKRDRAADRPVARPPVPKPPRRK